MRKDSVVLVEHRSVASGYNKECSFLPTNIRLHAPDLRVESDDVYHRNLERSNSRTNYL